MSANGGGPGGGGRWGGPGGRGASLGCWGIGGDAGGVLVLGPGVAEEVLDALWGSWRGRGLRGAD